MDAKITQIDANSFALEDYSSQDENLISQIDLSTFFNPSTDYIEYFVYNVGNRSQIYPYGNSYIPFTGYTLEDNILTLNIARDLNDRDLFEGSYNVLYNFKLNLLYGL